MSASTSAENPSKKNIFLINWGLYPSLETIQEGLEKITKEANIQISTYYNALPFPTCLSLLEKYKDSHLVLGVDNLLSTAENTFTGSIAIKLLAEAKIPFVILNASDQRKANPSSISKQISDLIPLQIIPFVCFGETLEDYEKGNSKTVIVELLQNLLKDVSPDHLLNIHLIYDASWIADVTFKPSNEKLLEALHLCRDILKEQLGEPLGKEISLLTAIPYDIENFNSIYESNPINGCYFNEAGLNFEKLCEYLLEFNKEKIKNVSSVEEQAESADLSLMLKPEENLSQPSPPIHELDLNLPTT